MNARSLLTVAVIASFSPSFSSAQESTRCPDWDQKKAVEKVKCILALEAKGDMFSWDKIAWKTDPAEAAALARKEQKPIFVFFFLKKNVGPAAAPC